MRLRLTVFALSVLGVFAAVLGLLHHAREMQLLTQAAGGRLQSIATTAAPALDGDAHDDAARCLSTSCPNYVKLCSYLRKVQQANGLATEVYTLARAGNATRFVIRTAHEASLGQSYDLRPEMLPVFDRGETAVTGPYTDRHGRWLSAYAPVRDRKGRVVALLEADYRASEVIASIAREAAVFATGAFALLAAIGLVTIRVADSLARPLVLLAGAMEATGRGQAPPDVALDAPAETGVLARCFARMRVALEQHRTEERLALVGRMAASLVHDLRSGRWVITGLAEQMQGEDRSPARREIGRRVCLRARRIEQMCQDLLDHSRGTVHLALELVALRELIATVVHDVAGQLLTQRVGIANSVPHALVVRADPTKLSRVLCNLVRDAIEAMRDGGRLSLSATRGPEGVTIDVADTGPGLPPDVAERLFEPFVTSGKAGGTGLGLCIVKSFVEAHGGSIEVRTQVGEGTRFTIHLPGRAAPSVVARPGPIDTQTRTVEELLT